MTRRKDPSVLQHPHWDKTPIVAIRPDGTVAARFENPQDAIINAGVNSGNLYQSLNGRRGNTNGFVWMKESEYRETWLKKGPEAMKWERSKVVRSGKRKGFRPGHKGFNTWVGGKDTEKRRSISRECAMRAHEAIRKKIIEGTFHPHRKKVRCITTGVVFDSMRKAADYAGLHGQT